MAMMARRNFCVSSVYFVQVFIYIIISLQVIDELEANPSAISLKIRELDGNYLLNEDYLQTAYHIHKRSLNLPKKASASLEKKFQPKDNVSGQFEKLKLEAKAASIDNSTYNSTVLNVSTSEVNSANEKYNISATDSPPSPVTAVNSGSSTIITNTTNGTTTSTTTTITSSTTTVPSIAIATTNSTISPIVTTVSSTVSSTVSVTPDSDVLPTKPSDVTNTTVDHHVYYNSTIFLDKDKAMSFWVNFDDLPRDRVVVHRMLSDSYRRAATVTLSFDFPFYGHPLRNITIATGGFVYMGDYMHSWLAATQYIAPLMANFDTRLSEESTVRYFDNGTAFVIEWHKVTLQNEDNGGNFTFQATLLNNGNIIFVYEVIPVSVTEIGDAAHPVKVGLSDAYVIDRVIYFIRRKTIYEYHRIDMKKEEIGNHTAIYFTALTTCLSYRDCKSCMGADVGLNCVWCESTKRCSDGLDRLRQDWLQSKCDVEKSTVNCSALPSPDLNPYVQPLTDTPSKPYTLFPRTPKPDYHSETTPVPFMPDKPGTNNEDGGASTSARVAEDSSTMGVGSVIAILLILAIVMGGLVWVGYAYRNPHTSSGQLLIRYRPSQWRFRSGEARYTAASVHM